MPEPWKGSLFFSILVFLHLSFIPGGSTFVILMSFALKSFLYSIIVQFISTIVSASLTFFFTNRCLKHCLEKKFDKTTLYNVAKQESKNHPWKLNIAFRFMYIPVTFKNVVLSLSGTSFLVYFISLTPEVFLFGSIYTFIGISLNNASDYYKPGGFKKQDSWGKIKIVLGYIIILVTILILICICRFTKNKIKAYEVEEKRKKEQEILDSQISLNEMIVVRGDEIELEKIDSSRKIEGV